jgi:transcriptional regulator with XRE-family HTH domain
VDTFTTALKQLKTRKEYSIAEMSRLSGVHRTVIAGYLNGRNPSPPNRESLADGLLAPQLHRAGFLEKECEECGTTFTYDPRDYDRRFCKRKCNIRATATRHKYEAKYALARRTHDLADHMEAVSRFCDWCTGNETRCPEPKSCPLAKVSPYNYDTPIPIQTRVPAIPSHLTTVERVDG